MCVCMQVCVGACVHVYVQIPVCLRTCASECGCACVTHLWTPSSCTGQGTQVSVHTHASRYLHHTSGNINGQQLSYTERLGEGGGGGGGRGEQKGADNMPTIISIDTM